MGNAKAMLLFFGFLSNLCIIVSTVDFGLVFDIFPIWMPRLFFGLTIFFLFCGQSSVVYIATNLEIDFLPQNNANRSSIMSISKEEEVSNGFIQRLNRICCKYHIRKSIIIVFVVLNTISMLISATMMSVYRQR